MSAAHDNATPDADGEGVPGKPGPVPPQVAEPMQLAATVPLPTADPSTALSQMGGAWPTDGRAVGIIAAADADLDGVRPARQAVLAAERPADLTGAAAALPAGGTAPAAGRPVLSTRASALDAGESSRHGRGDQLYAHGAGPRERHPAKASARPPLGPHPMHPSGGRAARAV